MQGLEHVQQPAPVPRDGNVPAVRAPGNFVRFPLRLVPWVAHFEGSRKEHPDVLGLPELVAIFDLDFTKREMAAKRGGGGGGERGGGERGGRGGRGSGGGGGGSGLRRCAGVVATLLRMAKQGIVAHALRDATTTTTTLDAPRLQGKRGHHRTVVGVVQPIVDGPVIV